jgi:hypothetical protein
VQFPPLTPTGANPGQTPGIPPPPTSGFQQSTGAGAPGFGPGAPTGAAAAGQQQSAANLIQSILTTPRQPPSATGGFTTGSTGGIAGVAGTAEGKGIHVVNDHNKYKEWEFVYDVKKDKTVVGAAAVNGQQQMQQQMQQNQSGANSPFGNSTGTGNSTGNSPFSSGSTSSPGTSSAPTTAPPSQ